MTTLVSIGGGHQLAPAAAAAYQRARAAGCPAGITSSYRDPARQAELRALYLAGKHAAYVAPVERSEHVTGNALDLPAGGPREWMRAHGLAFGFEFTDPTEAWHVAYRLDRDQHLTDSITPPTPLKEDPDMLVLAKLKNSPRILIGNGVTARHVTSPAELADIQSMMRAGVLRGDPKVHEVVSIGWLGKEV